MSDQPTLGQILARIEDVAATTASMRVEFADALNKAAGGLAGRLDGLDGRLDGLDGRLDGLDGRLDQLNERQSDFFDELGKTRTELMDRMQTVRTDVTVNLAAARVAEQAGRGALEQGHVLADALAALTLQVRQLQDRVDALQNGKDRGGGP